MISPVTQIERVVKYSYEHSVRAAAMVFGVSRSTVYRWRKAYELYCLEKLEPKSTAPRRRNTVVTQHLVDKVRLLRVTGMGAVKTAAIVRRDERASVSVT
ncbi:MAG: helix-turn-helix domain-containing protein [Candidatus Thorarchaeota archaeon]|nr:helix-turn-helix domain-containing protein [Candidatus Thorarchaeota archaeon]